MESSEGRAEVSTTWRDWREPSDGRDTAGMDSEDGRGLLIPILSFSNSVVAGAGEVSSFVSSVVSVGELPFVFSTLTLSTASFPFPFSSVCSCDARAVSFFSLNSAAAELSILGLGLGLDILGVVALEGGFNVGVCAPFRAAAALAATAFASLSCSLLFGFGVADLGGVDAIRVNVLASSLTPGGICRIGFYVPASLGAAAAAAAAAGFT